MKRFLFILPTAVFAAMLILRPGEAAEAVRGGMSLCFRTVIPSLFPFFAVSTFLLRLGAGNILQSVCSPFMGPIFRMRGVCALPLVTGLLGGYPTGAKTAAELYEQGTITRGEAELLLGFCNNCGPGFLLGFVGAGVLGSARAGAYILLIHTAAALLSGAILCRLPRRSEPPCLPCSAPAAPLSVSAAFVSAVSAALMSTLHICAYVVLFRTVTTLTGDGPPAAAAGILEMVSGMAGLSPDRAGFVAAAVLAAWGGVSVHCQTMSVTGELSLRYHTAGKILQTAISLLLAVMTAKQVYG